MLGLSIPSTGIILLTVVFEVDAKAARASSEVVFILSFSAWYSP